MQANKTLLPFRGVTSANSRQLPDEVAVLLMVPQDVKTVNDEDSDTD